MEHMSKYFPAGVATGISRRARVRRFVVSPTTVVSLTRISPDCRLETHTHPEAQLGMAIMGHLELWLDEGVWKLDALEQVYALHPQRPHGIQNGSLVEEAVGLEVVRLHEGETCAPDSPELLALSPERRKFEGLRTRHAAADWFEVMVSRIPPGAAVPAHRHKNEQIGVAVSGRYLMQVGGEEREMQEGDIYVAPPDILHSASNPFTEEACSVNIFFPPRYLKPRAGRRPERAST